LAVGTEAPRSEGKGHAFESYGVRHFFSELGTPKPAVFATEAATSVRNNSHFRPDDAKFLRVDFDTLGERAKMIAPVATPSIRNLLRAVLAKALTDWAAMVGPSRSIAPSALGVSTGPVPDRLQLGDTILQHQVREIGDTVFDGVVEPFELGVRLDGWPALLRTGARTTHQSALLNHLMHERDLTETARSDRLISRVAKADEPS
jgi:hypothetical protein